MDKVLSQKNMWRATDCGAQQLNVVCEYHSIALAVTRLQAACVLIISAIV